MNNKHSLRENNIAGRKKISPSDAKSASVAISHFLLEIIPENVSVAGYHAIKGEVDITDLLNSLFLRGNVVGLPVIEETQKKLKFLVYEPDLQLVKGKFGVPCPPEYLPEITPEILLVPMVAFDLEGNRLGYGGGYYDETIKNLRMHNKKLKVIGVAYNMQGVATMPVYDGDQKMDIVVTEKKVTRFT